MFTAQQHPLLAQRRAASDSPQSVSFKWSWERIPQKAVVQFTRSLAVMVKARLPLMQALSTAAAQNENKRLQSVLQDVRTHVQSGVDLSDSLAHHPRVFDSLYVQLVRVGEMAGILDDMLLRMATHLEKMAALRRKIRLALVYPGVILSVATGATFFFLTTIVPTFADMFRDFGRELPAPTRVVLAISDLATTYFGFLLLLMIGATGFCFYAKRTSWGQTLWDRMILQTPLWGTLILNGLLARFCRTLGTLLSSGVALVDALDILSAATGNRRLAQEVEHMLQAVQKGSAVADPMKRADLFPEMVVQMVNVGEQTGELDAMLLHAAHYYEEEVDSYLELLTSVIEPVLIITIGLVLGGILVSLYLPMFDMIGFVG